VTQGRGGAPVGPGRGLSLDPPRHQPAMPAPPGTTQHGPASCACHWSESGGTPWALTTPGPASSMAPAGTVTRRPGRGPALLGSPRPEAAGGRRPVWQPGARAGLWLGGRPRFASGSETVQAGLLWRRVGRLAPPGDFLSTGGPVEVLATGRMGGSGRSFERRPGPVVEDDLKGENWGARSPSLRPFTQGPAGPSRPGNLSWTGLAPCGRPHPGNGADCCRNPSGRPVEPGGLGRPGGPGGHRRPETRRPVPPTLGLPASLVPAGPLPRIR